MSLILALIGGIMPDFGHIVERIGDFDHPIEDGVGREAGLVRRNKSIVMSEVARI
ncbi:MAG: hypothetical protein EWM72_02195 [Nitrospira sp.]|nr:MAG: hypothetical protein EWM72_02195 [Nitrospira sp.]